MNVQYGQNYSPTRQIEEMNQYNLPPIAQDLAPRMNMLTNDIYHNTKKGFGPSGGTHTPGTYALESERNLIDKF